MLSFKPIETILQMFRSVMERTLHLACRSFQRELQFTSVEGIQVYKINKEGDKSHADSVMRSIL